MWRREWRKVSNVRKGAQSEEESLKWRRDPEVKKRAQSEKESLKWRREPEVNRVKTKKNKKEQKKWIFQALSKSPEAIYKKVSNVRKGAQVKKRAQSEEDSPKWRREPQVKKRAPSEEESPKWRREPEVKKWAQSEEESPKCRIRWCHSRNRPTTNANWCPKDEYMIFRSPWKISAFRLWSSLLHF